MDNKLETQYIYLLQEREFIKTGESIYKLGKTVQKCGRGFGERFKGYPKGSRVLLVIEVEDCNKEEGELIRCFKKEFKRRDDIGSEYFEGDIDDMKKTLCNHIFKQQKVLVEKQVEVKKFEDEKEVQIGNNICKNCGKELSNYFSCWRHQQKCNNIDNLEMKKQLEKLKNKVIELENKEK
jgi:hypothetical protein